MPRTFTFTECYAILQVDPKTFRNWLKKAGIDPEKQKSKLDERVRYLDEFQVKKLALDHGRDPELKRAMKPEGSDEQGVGAGQGVTISTHRLLDERVGTLESLEYVDPETVEALEARIEKLEEARTRDLQQITTLLVAIKELEEWKASLESKPKPGRKPKTSPAVGTPEYQAGLAAVGQGDSQPQV